jgi:hypothetical protein
MPSQTLPQTLTLARHSASARLDRLPITLFHRRSMWLSGFVFLYELGDVYSFGPVKPIEWSRSVPT